jgi:hypothetical protein
MGHVISVCPKKQTAAEILIGEATVKVHRCQKDDRTPAPRFARMADKLIVAGTLGSRATLSELVHQRV